MSADDRQKMSVGLTCKDMAASVRLYRDQLGFEMKESWPDERAPLWCNMVLNGQSVMLGAAMDPDTVAEMCGGDAKEAAYHRKLAEEFRANKPGVGVMIYLMVDDIDAYRTRITRARVQATEPKTQFYGIRESIVLDPDGYRLVFFMPVAMESCQSCGMPLADAQPGQMYCDYCTDDKGTLRPYEQVFEGTVQGYFMGMQRLSRSDAERAAKEHLARMPAWAGRG